MRAAVLGSPIGHSLSPVLHRAAYRSLQLDWDYDAIECSLTDLPARLAAARDPEWAGLSLTMPLKAAASGLVDDTRSSLGVINTVVRQGRLLIGHNTDVDGILAGLAELAVPLEDVCVLGAGGTARAALAALARLGCSRVVLRARDLEKAQPVLALGETLGLAMRGESWAQPPPGQVVISTVPAGVTDGLRGTGPLLDVVYAPWPTPLAESTVAGGCPAVGGLSVLVGQAVAQVRLMTGMGVSALVLRAAGEAALAGGSSEAGSRPMPNT